MTENPFDALSAAMRKRDRALTGIASWEERLAEAEEDIRQLTIAIANGSTTAAPFNEAPEPVVSASSIPSVPSAAFQAAETV